ncbi:hypothetical protein OURE66S_03418 [Oligella ureolytica]
MSMYLYRASGLQKNSAADTDEDEFVDTVLYSRQEVIAALKTKKLKMSKPSLPYSIGYLRVSKSYVHV